MRTAVAKKAAPETTSRKKPDFNGVPGELVALDGLALEFSARKSKGSPYDALLDQLADAESGKLLKFGDLRARTSVKVRALKKGLRVSFAELGSVLYVRLDGRADDDVRGTRRQRVKEALKFGPRAAGELLNFIRDKGDATIDLPSVDSILVQMMRSGDVIKQEGGKWARNPLAK